MNGHIILDFFVKVIFLCIFIDVYIIFIDILSSMNVSDTLMYLIVIVFIILSVLVLRMMFRLSNFIMKKNGKKIFKVQRKRNRPKVRL